ESRVLTYAEALNEALREEMRRDPTVFVFGEDVAVWGGGGIFGVTKGLVEEFGPERVRDTPISEEAIAALAVGAAATGTGPVAQEEYTAPLGVADVKREGSDVTVVGLQVLVNYAVEAAEELAAEGISVEVVDPRTVSPLDVDTIVSSVKKTGRLVIAHQAYEQGGIGAELAAR